MHLYAAHALLPGEQSMFDFGDVFGGPQTRAKQGDDYDRSHPNGHFESNYTVLYDLAARFHSADAQGVADWMKSRGHTAQEPWWTLVWRDDNLHGTPIAKLPAYHRFEDHDVAFWRSDWTPQATAFAFKCGPPEGHHTAAAVAKYPDFHIEEGHVHPDVASFILFAHGEYLTGVSGYAGVPRSIETNTLLVDGKGQGIEGGHDAWAKMDQAAMNNIRITAVHFTADTFDLTGEAAAAYAPSAGLTRFTRHIHLVRAPGRKTLGLSGTGELAIEDTITLASPKTLAEVLHTDTTFAPTTTGPLTTTVNGETLTATGKFSIPSTTLIEKNIVMGPGRPGSVDKGTLEQRGERALLSTTAPTTAATFTWSLTF